MGTKLTAGVTAPLVGSGVAVVKWAADLEQTMGATEQLWGSNADSILKWSESANTSMGMTQNEALTSANRFNAMFKQIDTDSGTIKDMSQGFTQLSADMSAMWGGSSIEASDSLTAALRGNYEGLDKYNINLTEAMVSQEAMNVAMADGRSEITESDKVQARYNLIMEQTTDTQGQFARETDTTAGKLAILRARVIDAATQFGKLLLPYVNKAADAFSKLVTWVENLSDSQRKWVLIIAAAAAALGPLLVVIGMLLPGIGALVAVIGFLVSPIGLVVVAVAALVAGLVYAYTHFEGFRNIVDTVASTIKDVLVGAFDMAVDAFNKLQDAFQADGWQGVISTLGSMIMNGLSQVFNAIRNIDWGSLVQGGWNVIQGGIALAWDAITSLDWGSFIPKIADLGKVLLEKVASLPWGDYITKIADFGKVVAGKIVSLPWGDYITAIADFGKVVASKILSLPWSDFITPIEDFFGSIWDALGSPTLDFPSKQDFIDTFLGWLGGDTVDMGKLVGNVTGDGEAQTPSSGGVTRTPHESSGSGPGGLAFNLAGWVIGTSAVDAYRKALEALAPVSSQSTIDMNKIASTGPVVGMSMQTTSGQVEGAGAGMQSTFGLIASSAASSFSATSSSASTQFGALASTVTSQSSNASKSATSQFSTMQSQSTAKFLGMQAAAAVQMALMAGSAKTQGAAMNTGITGWMAGALARISATLGQIPGIVASVGGSAASTAYSVGANISSSFAAGMLAYLGSIRASANAMVAEADRAVRAKARIASPSKVFMALGGYVGEGFEQGIRNATPGVGSAIDAMMATGTPSPAFSAPQISGFNTATPSVVNHIKVVPVSLAKDAFNDFVNQLESAPERTIDLLLTAQSMTGKGV